MEPGQPDVAEQLPASGNPMKPASGSYGDGASLDRLKASLPGAESSSAPSVRNLPPVAGPPPGATAPQGAQGLPAGLTRPTSMPDVPVSTPLMAPPQNPVAGAADARQQRLLLLDQIANSPSVSDETREWAATFRQKLIEASTL